MANRSDTEESPPGSSNTATEMRAVASVEGATRAHRNLDTMSSGSAEKSAAENTGDPADSVREETGGAVASNETEHTERPLLEGLATDSELKPDTNNWLERHNKVSIVVTGKTGVGKSTFINMFLGNREAQSLAAVAEGLTPKTKKVEGYRCSIINGVTVELYDTPGFEINEHWGISLKKIKKKFKNDAPDLVFFCVRMTEIPQKDDCEAMTSLSNAFGPAIWKNTVIDTWKSITRRQISESY